MKTSEGGALVWPLILTPYSFARSCALVFSIFSFLVAVWPTKRNDARLLTSQFCLNLRETSVILGLSLFSPGRVTDLALVIEAMPKPLG
jgi:hypothetical protein